MEFGWINLWGAVIVIVMMIPNIVYAVKFPNQENKCKNRFMNIIEQAGRYGCIVLMWFPIFVWKFGFQSIFEMLAYISGSAILLLMYWIIWLFYIRKQTMKTAIALAVIPTIIFLLCGILLRHWALIVAAVSFGIGHNYVTVRNHQEEVE